MLFAVTRCALHRDARDGSGFGAGSRGGCALRDARRDVTRRGHLGHAVRRRARRGVFATSSSLSVASRRTDFAKVDSSRWHIDWLASWANYRWRAVWSRFSRCQIYTSSFSRSTIRLLIAALSQFRDEKITLAHLTRISRIYWTVATVIFEKRFTRFSSVFSTLSAECR